MKNLLLKLLLSAVLLGVFLWRTPLGDLWQHLELIDGWTLLLTSAALIGLIWMAAVRLWCLLPGFHFLTIVRLTFVGQFYGMVLPGQVAGDVVKAYRLGATVQRRGHAEAATLIDRVLALLAMFGIGVIATSSDSAAPPPIRWFFIVGGIILLTCLVCAALLPVRSEAFRRLLPAHTNKIRSFLHHFVIAMHECLREPARVGANLLLAFAFHAISVLIHSRLGHALQIDLGLAQWALVYASVSLLLVLPVSIAGIGVREGGYVGALALYGVTSTAALSLSFSVLGLTMLGAVAGGVIEAIQASHQTASRRV